MLVVQGVTRDKLNRSTRLTHAMLFFINVKKFFDCARQKIVDKRRRAR
jgi:hypothetical protein